MSDLSRWVPPYTAGPPHSIDGRYMFWKRCLLQAERSKESQREQNWTKVSSLMLRQQLSNQCVAPVLNELHGPTVHIPPTSVFPFLALFVLHLLSLPQNGRWESIPHHKSNHIILSFSITTLSLPPSLHPPHSITLPFSSPACFCLGHHVPLRTGYIVWWKLNGDFPQH